MTLMFQGEPYLHVVNNLMVVPGMTKHTARVLMFDPRSQTMDRVRDLVHRKHWVLGAYLGQKQGELEGGRNCFQASY